MLSGKDTFDHLNSTLRSARRELERLDRDLQATSDAVARNRQQQAHAIKRLAAIRLDEISRGEVARRIDAADYEVEQILERRQRAIAELGNRSMQAVDSLGALEARRDELHADVDTAARTLAEREASVQEALALDAGFQSQLERTRAADAIAVSASDKASVAMQDRILKGEPYENDELFTYLWNRRYGTSEYRANPLARMLDARVAKLCAYEDARPNYWMLLEIPKRLQEHAVRKRDEAELELDKLQAIEERAAKDGGVEDARKALAVLEERQDRLDADIEAAEAALHELQVEQSSYAAGTDHHIAQCLGVLASAIERRDVSELTRLAMATMTAEDDAIVDDLRELRRNDGELQDELRHRRKLHQDHLRRVRDLEQVRHRFKRHRYDDVRSSFKKGDLLVTMMQEVLGGAVRGGALWDALRRYQRYRDVAGEWPDFGSGGITRTGRRPPTRRPTWHWPGPSGSSRRGGFKLPRLPRSRGRGGFRTGGGF